jgi:predicted ribosome quality control (RQC) complex YloA/Tae2 family protein
LGGLGKELECNNIDSYRRKGSLLIQTLYLWEGIEEGSKKKREGNKIEKIEIKKVKKKNKLKRRKD